MRVIVRDARPSDAARSASVARDGVLDVHSRNERGLAFYRRHGFVVAGGGATPDCDLTLRRHPPAADA